jgi:tetratricopeptide (TPR) repeat protein
MPEAVEEAEEADEAGLEIPDDPDEAMAWLEQLAAQQGAPLDELPTVNVVEEMSTPVTGIEMIDFEPEMEIEAVPEAEAEPDSDVDVELEMALAELSDIEMPEDDDEALAWLAALAGGDTSAEEDVETAVVDEAEDFFEPVHFEEEPEVVQEIDVFEPFDETLDSIETFDYEEETLEASLFDEIEEEPDLFGGGEDEALAEIDSDLEADNLEDALPDWLQFGSIGESSQTDLDWLDSFEETGGDNWLAAEEAVSSSVMQSLPPAAEPEPVVFEPQEPEVDEVEPYEEELPTPVAQTGPLDQNQLESARTAVEIGDMNSALEKYKSLLDAGQDLPLLIAELETEAGKHGTNAGLQRLLGDAYMQNGQLQKAIDTYRQALDNL